MISEDFEACWVATIANTRKAAKQQMPHPMYVLLGPTFRTDFILESFDSEWLLDSPVTIEPSAFLKLTSKSTLPVLVEFPKLE